MGKIVTDLFVVKHPHGHYKREVSLELEDFAVLYRRAFAEYGTHVLWNKKMLDNPTPDDALVVARALHIEGDRNARRLAERIEQACRRAPH